MIRKRAGDVLFKDGLSVAFAALMNAELIGASVSYRLHALALGGRG